MLTLPAAIVPLLSPFATLFTNPTWHKAQVLLVGAILAPGQRTVAAALRVMGRSDQGDYARYHAVLNLPVWSPFGVPRRTRKPGNGGTMGSSITMGSSMRTVGRPAAAANPWSTLKLMLRRDTGSGVPLTVVPSRKPSSSRGTATTSTTRSPKDGR